MKKIQRFILPILVLGMTSCKKEVVKNLDVVDSSPIDVVHQDIELEVDWKSKKLLGITKLNLKPLVATDKITLNAAELDIMNIEDEEGNVLSYRVMDSLQVLDIDLGKTYTGNNEFSIVIEYQTHHQNQSDPANIWGSFGNGVRYFEPTRTEKERRKQLWAFGEPKSARYWFPSNDIPNDIRTTAIKIKVEHPLMALSNGDLLSSVLKDGI